MKVPVPTLDIVRLRKTNIRDVVVIDPEIPNDFWIVVWWNADGDVRLTNISRATTRGYHTKDSNDDILVYRLSHVAKELL